MTASKHEIFCLYKSTKRRLYYCSSKGRILAINQKDPSQKHYLRKLSSHPNAVKIENKITNISLIMVKSFYKPLFKLYQPKNYKIIYKNGDKRDLNLSNIFIYLEDIEGSNKSC